MVNVKKLTEIGLKQQGSDWVKGNNCSVNSIIENLKIMVHRFKEGGLEKLFQLQKHTYCYKWWWKGSYLYLPSLSSCFGSWFIQPYLESYEKLVSLTTFEAKNHMKPDGKGESFIVIKKLGGN